MASAARDGETAVTAVSVYKMTGSGNDFVVLDGRVERPEQWPSARIVAACDRRRGVGADGLVILTPEAGTTVRMVFYNADGSRAAMCGNAALCSTRLSAVLGLAPPAGMCLETDAGVVHTRCIGAGDLAELLLPPAELPRAIPALRAGPGETGLCLGTVGVPHLVVIVPDIEAVDVLGRGRALRFDPALGPDGANINFVQTPAEAGGAWLIRTYERGVEGETLACGTGTVAAAIAMASAGRATLPATYLTRSGKPLVVSARLAGTGATEVRLQGQGRLVFRGDYEG